jgi:hypothetical protein
MALVEYGDVHIDEQSLRESIDRHECDAHVGERIMSS